MSVLQESNSFGGSGTTIQITFASPVAAGSTIHVFAVSDFGGPVPDCSDDLNGGPYPLCGVTGDLQSDAVQGAQMLQMRWEGSAAGTMTVTLTWLSSVSFRGIYAVEIAGPCELDGHNGNTEQTPTTGTDALTAGLATNARAPATAIGLALQLNQAGDNPIEGTGFTALPTAWGGGAGQALGEWSIVSSSAVATTATWTPQVNVAHFALFAMYSEPAATGAGPGGDFSASPQSRRRVPPRVDGWDPLPQISTPALQRFGFSLSPEPVRRARARVDAWNPLPTVPVESSPWAWGFSPGQSSSIEQRAPLGWEPLPAIAGASTARSGFDSAAPLPRARARARVDGWEPLASVGRAGVDSAPALPPRRPPARVDAWEPLASLPRQLAVDVSAPLAPRRARLRVEAWEPLPNLPTPAAGIAVDLSAPLSPPRARLRVEAWEPLPNLPTPAALARVAVAESPQAPARARARVEAWDPLPALAAPAPGVSVDSPRAPRRERLRVEAWEPIAPLLSDVASCDSPQPTRRARARVDGWEPLPTLIPTAPTLWGFDAQPVAYGRRKTARPDYWEPLGDIAIPPATVPQPYLLSAMT